MKRLLSISVVFVAFAVLIGCGTKTKPPASKLSITPTTKSVATGQAVQFTVTATDNPTPAVYWYVNDMLGGSRNPAVGIISINGQYIAPGTVPNPATVTVKAQLISDATQTASATVTITAGTPVAVTITPTEADVAAGQSQQFTPTVSNTLDTFVSWMVNDVAGGNSVNGIIDQSGMYFAPAKPPTDNDGNPLPVTITATALADPTKTATATVNVKPFNYISVTPSVLPALAAGATQQFTATRSGQPVSNATWTVHCNSEAPGACGSVDATGLYTAPLSPPPGSDVTVTAASSDPANCTSGHDCIHAGGAVVTVQFSNASLSGSYALSFSGKNAAGTYTAAGSIAFDGSTNITGGELDINNGGVSHVTVTGGSYNIGASGRGVATINTANGPLNWSMVLVNHTQAHVISANAVGPVGSGTLDLQDSAAFDVASVHGAYALSITGPNAHNAATFAMAGAISADGAGQITLGVLDINDAGTVHSNLSLTAGSYTAPSSDGRGTMTTTSSFGTQSFVYYVVDADHVKLLSAGATAGTGNLTKQAAGPFSGAGFHGGFAFVLAGSKAGQPHGVGGIFQLNGAGVLTTGTMDINSNGNVTAAQSIAGTYEVADPDTGRTTLTVTVNGTATHYVIYPQVDGLNLIGTDTTEVTSGLALAQHDTNFTGVTIAGVYGLSLAGADLADNPGEEAVIGQIVPNGSTAITGVLYINDNAVIGGTVPLQSATYHAASNGRFSATLSTAFAPFTSAGFNVYVVDANRALWLETDSTRVLTGIMQKQY